MQHHDIAPLFGHVPLTNRRGDLVGLAAVDPDFLAEMRGHRWHLGSNGYARRNLNGKAILMHRVIVGLSPADGLQVDHINRNRLDNRRANLRIVTHQENHQNRGPTRGHKYCGVYFAPKKNRTGRWRARIKVDGKLRHIGWFKTEEEAGRAAEAWSRENLPQRWQAP